MHVNSQQEETNTLIHVDCFSGIGGFGISAKWAGINFNKTYYSDVDEFANKVYAKNFPDAVPLGDITQVDWSIVKQNDERDFKGTRRDYVVTGGFP